MTRGTFQLTLAAALLAPACRVMGVLASASQFPLLGDTASLQQRLEASVHTPSAAPPVRGYPSTLDFPRTLFGAAAAHDAWLNHLASGTDGRLPSDVVLLGTFPGLLVTELMATAVPAWLVPLLQLAMAPLARARRGLRGAAHARTSCRVSELEA